MDVVVTDLPPPWVAHAGEGATWQALLVAISFGVLVVAALALLGRLRLQVPDDLVVPLASVAVLSSLAPVADAWLSDMVGWALPAGAVVLVGLVVAALTPLEFTPRSRLTWVTAAVAVVLAATLHQPLTRAWHPPPTFLPLADDASVEIVGPDDGEVVGAGRVEVTVAVRGGTIGPGDVPLADLPTDPEEAGDLTVTVDQEQVEVGYLETCTVTEPCTSVTFPVDLEPGEREVTVEFTRGDGTALAPFVADRVVVEAR